MTSRKSKTDRQKLIKTCDTLVSQLIRIRDKGKCRKCGRRSKTCSPHHIFSRRYLNTRWDEENLLFLCFPCHFNFAHSRVEEFRDWILSWMGEVKYMLLKKKALSVRGFKIGDLKMVKVYLEQEIKNKGV